MIKFIQKNRLIIALSFIFFAAVLFSFAFYSPYMASAADDNTEAYKTAYDTAGKLTYSELEKTDYATEKYCEYIGVSSSLYDGVYDKTAVKKDSTDKNYQLLFRNAFAKGKSYEITFRTKFVSPAANTYVMVWYVGRQNGVYVKENRELDSLKCEKGEEGTWKKYVVKFKSDVEGIYESYFRLTLECKNFGADTEIYFDEFHAYEVSDDNSLFSGGEMSDKEWNVTAGNAEKSGFTENNAPFAMKLSQDSKIESNFLNVRSNGILHIRFAYKADDGSSLFFGIKDPFGNVIGKTELTATASRATVNVVTADLKKYDFIKVFFENQGSGSAAVGLAEAIPHTHEFEDGNGYPKYDLTVCKTIRFCKSCGFEVDFTNHTMAVVKEATCNTAGRRECTSCHNYSEVIPATGKHVYDKDVTCSPDNNPREKVACKVCGETIRLQKAHTFEYFFVDENVHLKRCTVCRYEEQSEHIADSVLLVEAPTMNDNGTAVCVCKECENSYMVQLPSLAKESEWNKTVVKEVKCEEDGIDKYDWVKGDLSIEVTVEATGHEYEEIHTSATCETEGKSVYHKCRICGDIYENPEDIITFAPLGHSESDWITEVTPTTKSEGLQRKYCNRCKKMTEERVVPKLNDKDYDKYILEDPEKTDGYLYRYTSKIYGTFTEYEPKSKSDKVLLIVLSIVFVLALAAAAAIFIIFTKKEKTSEIGTD